MEEIKSHEPKVRPLFLTVLCIIAFVHVGLSIFIGVISTIASGIPDAFSAIPYIYDFSGMVAAIGGLFFSAISLVLAIIGFLGIIQMWNLLKTGFWTFTISMLLFLIVPFLFPNLPFRWVLIITLPNLIIIPSLMVLFAYNYKKFQ